MAEKGKTKYTIIMTEAETKAFEKISKRVGSDAKAFEDMLKVYDALKDFTAVPPSLKVEPRFFTLKDNNGPTEEQEEYMRKMTWPRYRDFHLNDEELAILQLNKINYVGEPGLVYRGRFPRLDEIGPLWFNDYIAEKKAKEDQEVISEQIGIYIQNKDE